MKSSDQRQMNGFTLIELMVGVALLGVLLMLAYPSYTSVIRNAQIRTAADSVINGLQLARAEAIRRNSNVRFQLLNTSAEAAVTGGTDWQIKASDMASPTTFGEILQTRRETSKSSTARLGAANSVSGTAAVPGAGMPADIVFTGMGRLSAATAVRQIDITGADQARRLAIVLAPGGDVRLCDPGLSVSINPQGCS